MAPDSAVASGASAEHEVMAAVDEGQLIIADLAVEDAWLSMPATDATVLGEFR